MSTGNFRSVPATDPEEPRPAQGRSLSYHRAVVVAVQLRGSIWKLAVPGVVTIACDATYRHLGAEHVRAAMLLIPVLAILKATMYGETLAVAVALVRHRNLGGASTLVLRRLPWLVTSGLSLAVPVLVLFALFGGPDHGLETKLSLAAPITAAIFLRLFYTLPAVLEARESFLTGITTPLSSFGLGTGQRAKLWAGASLLAYLSFHGTYGHVAPLCLTYSALEPILLWPVAALIWGGLYIQLSDDQRWSTR